MQLCQRALGSQYMGEDTLRMAVIRACQGVPSLEIALFRPAKTCEELFANLCSSIKTSLSHVASVYLQDDVNNTHYLDRQYTNSRHCQNNSFGGYCRNYYKNFGFQNNSDKQK